MLHIRAGKKCSNVKNSSSFSGGPVCSWAPTLGISQLPLTLHPKCLTTVLGFHCYKCSYFHRLLHKKTHMHITYIYKHTHVKIPPKLEFSLWLLFSILCNIIYNALVNVTVLWLMLAIYQTEKLYEMNYTLWLVRQ